MNNMMKLTASALILTTLLAGCATVRGSKCPSLANPPSSVVDALETAGRADPNASAWVIGLDRHYQKLDICKG